MTEEGGLIPIGVNGFKGRQGRLKKKLLENISNPKLPGHGQFVGFDHGYKYVESEGNDKSLEHSQNL